LREEQAGHLQVPAVQPHGRLGDAQGRLHRPYPLLIPSAAVRSTRTAARPPAPLATPLGTPYWSCDLLLVMIPLARLLQSPDARQRRQKSSRDSPYRMKSAVQETPGAQPAPLLREYYSRVLAYIAPAAAVAAGTYSQHFGYDIL